VNVLAALLMVVDCLLSPGREGFVLTDDLTFFAQGKDDHQIQRMEGWYEIAQIFAAGGLAVASTSGAFS
jgi:hypothetical protein